MATVRDIEAYLWQLAPRELKLDFDNVGLLAGFPENQVSRVLVSLDITDAVIEEAVYMGAELIVAHHPLFLDEQKNILTTDATGRKIISLIEKGISAICMHTNLDAAEGGVNDALAHKLGGRVSGILNDEDRISRIAELSEAEAFPDFLARACAALDSNGLRYHDAGRPVRRMGLCGGSGGQDLELAFRKGCDTFVSADIKYHQFLLAEELNINLIDADHFCTENVIVPILADKITKHFGGKIRAAQSRVHRQTAQFYIPDMA